MRSRPMTLWFVLLFVLLGGNVLAAIVFYPPSPIEPPPPAPPAPPIDTGRRPEPPVIPSPPPDTRKTIEPPPAPVPSPPTPPAPAPRLTGDVLLLVIDSDFFRSQMTEWRRSLGALMDSPAVRPRLLDERSYLVDRDGVRSWTPSEPLPPARRPFGNRDWQAALAKGLAELGQLRRQAAADPQAFVLWSSDVRPDDVGGQEPWPRVEGGWTMLLWHGVDTDRSDVLARIFPHRQSSDPAPLRLLNPLKQDDARFRGTVEFYLRKPE